jgi:glycosyltransferase involved in cell wall biosynthesis
VLLILFGLSVYLAVVLSAACLHLVFIVLGEDLDPQLRTVLWYTGVPVFAGLFLCLWDLFLLMPHRRRGRSVPFDSAMARGKPVTVVLTAYNDVQSIPLAVSDFRSHPMVRRVIVVDNNSSDKTAEAARRAGAEVVVEMRPGYGHCVFRALSEAIRYRDTDQTLLCEGDMTFRSYDIDKFLAYIPHGEIINGTRIVEQLRETETQLTTFMYYGNFFAAKLLEAKHLGQGTFTDVGTTYKLCRNSTLEELLPLLDPSVNLEFNAHFMDTALDWGFRLLECPITFHQRVGRSKGGNTSNLRAFKVGIRMIIGIVFSWKYLRENR